LLLWLVFKLLVLVAILIGRKEPTNAPVEERCENDKERKDIDGIIYAISE